jgi:hypothetical protein
MRVHQIAAVLSVAALGATGAVPASADESPAKTDKARAEVQQERKELKEKLKENRQELKEKQTELKQELKEKKDELGKEASEQRQELKEALAKLRETRADRRKADRDALRQKFGSELLARPTVREELKTHAIRTARLNQIKRLAEDAKKKNVVTRADKLIERENARHDKQMLALKSSEGATTPAAAQANPNPGSPAANPNAPNPANPSPNAAGTPTPAKGENK